MEVGGEKFMVWRSILLALPDSVFPALLSSQSAGTSVMQIRRPREHFASVLVFLRMTRDGNSTSGAGSSSQPIVPESNEAAAIAAAASVAWSMPDCESRLALREEAQFYHLNPLIRVLQCDEALNDADFSLRLEENLLRTLFVYRRNGPEVDNLHACLKPLFAEDASRSISVDLSFRPPDYPLLLDTLTPRYGIASDRLARQDFLPAVPKFEEFVTRWEKCHPGLLERLMTVQTTPRCGWFIAGGSVLRCLMNQRIAPSELDTDHEDDEEYLEKDRLYTKGDLFQHSDVDIFIYCRGGALQEQATDLARRIYEALDCPEVSRTLFVINMDVSDLDSKRPAWERRSRFRGLYRDHPRIVQIILRVYHSPSEVLTGFDIDSCCFGFDGLQVWALPRALRSLERGCIIHNPLHAWPIQPSYECAPHTSQRQHSPCLTSHILLRRLRLAKYAARGFPCAVPGLDTRDLDWNTVVRNRLCQLNLGARLLHVHIALSLPEHRRLVAQKRLVGCPHDKTGEDWENALRVTFGKKIAYVHCGYSGEWVHKDGVIALPTDGDLARTLVQDPCAPPHLLSFHVHVHVHNMYMCMSMSMSMSMPLPSWCVLAADSWIKQNYDPDDDRVEPDPDGVHDLDRSDSPALLDRDELVRLGHAVGRVDEEDDEEDEFFDVEELDEEEANMTEANDDDGAGLALAEVLSNAAIEDDDSSSDFVDGQQVDVDSFSDDSEGERACGIHFAEWSIILPVLSSTRPKEESKRLRWAGVVDARRDNLHPRVPRIMEWTTAAVSREYRNMGMEFKQLHYRYWAHASVEGGED